MLKNLDEDLSGDASTFGGKVYLSPQITNRFFRTDVDAGLPCQGHLSRFVLKNYNKANRFAGARGEREEGESVVIMACNGLGDTSLFHNVFLSPNMTILLLGRRASSFVGEQESVNTGTSLLMAIRASTNSS